MQEPPDGPRRTPTVGELALLVVDLPGVADLRRQLQGQRRRKDEAD